MCFSTLVCARICFCRSRLLNSHALPRKLISNVLQPLSNDIIVFSDCLFPALTLCTAAIETLGHTASPTDSETREMFNAALGRLLEFLRQDCCFAREDVQRLLQIKLRKLCPNLSAHFVLVAQLEASAGITNHYNHDHQRSHQQQQLIASPPPDASPWTLVRATFAPDTQFLVGRDCRFFLQLQSS